MKYLIGIDGGATKTECAITNLSGKIFHRSLGKPSNFLAVGLEAAAENLFELIEGSLFKLEADFSNVEMILIGTAGAGREDDALRLENKLLEYAESERIHLKSVKVVSDARIALEGAFSGKPGCILISGTGSILFSKDEKGEIHRAGGYGRLIGDEGSGYSIGRKGLAAAGKEMDGRDKKTLITKYLKENYNISSSEQLINKVYKENFDIASAAQLVLEAAKAKDTIATKILSDEADELVLHIHAMKKQLKNKRMRIAFIGSMIENNNPYTVILKKKIEDKLPDVELYRPENPPVIGAILLAKSILNERS